MKSLEEIKAIIYPKEEVDMKEVIKDLLKQTHNEGELVTFDRIYLYSWGDPDLYITGISLINDKLIVATEMVYGKDTDAVFIGTVSDNGTSMKKGFEITKDAFIKIGQRILEKKTNIDFDFKNMKGLDCYYFCGDSLEENLGVELAGGKTIKEVLDAFINGEDKGYLEV
jgi:restriction endonuclease S subunit